MNAQLSERDKDTDKQERRERIKESKYTRKHNYVLLLNTIQVRKNLYLSFFWRFLLFALRSEFWVTVENVLRFSPGLDTTVDSPFHILY
jgi:hypothetical protein